VADDLLDAVNWAVDWTAARIEDAGR
jgi:hypothetical protein